ncbi:MAG: thioredoxin domain-containing protein [Thermodesulfobacteriota bacterium]
MRVKFLGAAILALSLFIFVGTSFAEQISTEESERLKTFFLNRFGATIPAGAEVAVSGFEASGIEGFKKGDFIVSTDRGEQEIAFLLTDDGKYALIGTPTSTADFKATEVKGVKEGTIAYGSNAVPVLVSDDGKNILIGATIASTKNFKDSGFAGFKQGTVQAGGRPVPLLIQGDAQYVVIGAEVISTADFEDTEIEGLKKGQVGGGGRAVPLFASTDGKFLILATPGLGTDIMDTTVDIHKEVMDQISLENVPSKGAENGKVAVVEYSDFQCPFCKRGKDMLPMLLKEYGDDVTIYFKQLPLPNHNWAMKASIASLCAYEQGNDKFWEFHDMIFDNQSKIKLDTADEIFNGYAKEIGLNTQEFDKCVKSDEIAARVKADMAETQAIGINSTPTFVINGMKVPGANPDGVKSAIDVKLSEGS